MFTTEQRDSIRNLILDVAKRDSRITSGALIGSAVAGAEDEWSDIDLTFGVADGVRLEEVLDDWTQVLDHELGVLHHWDLPYASSIYRVFLITLGMQVDVSVTPQHDFGARGPNFRLLFGAAREPVPSPRPEPRYLTGLCWVYVLHARSSIERGKLWQAEHWISELRDEVFSLACLRLGENAREGRGVHRLPPSVTEPFEDTLVRSLDRAELRRALGEAARCFIEEVEKWDPALSARLRSPILM